MSDGMAVLGEVVGLGPRWTREAEDRDASVPRLARAESIAWLYGPPSASPAVRMARLPRWAVGLPMARRPKKEKSRSRRNEKSEGNGTTRAPYPSQQRLTYSGPKTVEEWGTPQGD